MRNIVENKGVVVEINTSNYGSTGSIMNQISDICWSRGIVCHTSCAGTSDNQRRNRDKQIFIGSQFWGKVDAHVHRYLGLNAFSLWISTAWFLHKVSKIHPDIIHLHNLHGSYINAPLVFKYVKKHQISVIWTLHDCWAFTGHCPHYSMVGCDKWRSGCYECPKFRDYPYTYNDMTRKVWIKKRKWFTGVGNMTIVTPSQWLADQVKSSFLGYYPVKVINNGIDLSIFKPIESDFKEKHGINGIHMILGVSFDWSKRKGLDVFIRLTDLLNEQYCIVLVGTDEEIERILPERVIPIRRTQNQSELAEIYSMADVFVNPTREENYPTVNMEALACGTPVVTFETGGSPEIIDDTCGSVVGCDDIISLGNEIIRICEEKPYTHEACVQRAKSFDMNKRFMEYVDLYRSIIEARR